MTPRIAELIHQWLGWCLHPDAFQRERLPGISLVPGNMSKSRTIVPQRILALVLILMLPLLPALMVVGYSLVVPIVLPSTELQKAVRVLIIGIPLAILICYGRRTGDGTGSTLSGVLLFPFFTIYSQVLSQMFDPGFVMTPLGWLIWSAFTSTVPFGLILGVMGYCASRKTNGSLLIAVSLAGLVMVIMMGIN